MKITLKKYTIKGVRTLRTPIELKRLGNSQSQNQQRLADIISNARKPEFLPIEREWTHKIESKRSDPRNREEVALTIDTYMMGICLIKKNNTKNQRKRTSKQSFKMMYL